MKLCRFDAGRLGVVEGNAVFDVTPALEVLPQVRYPLPHHDPLIADLPAVCAAVRNLRSGARSMPLSAVRLLSPIANPSKIIGAPINYQSHIDESMRDKGISHGRAVTTIRDWGLFLKATTSLIGFGEEIVLRRPDRRNDHECELAVVIGEPCHKIARADALRHVAGYAIGLDMTVRGPEFQCWRKSVDTYSVLGPWLVTADEIPDPDTLDLALSVNGQPRQRSNTRHLVVDVGGLIEMASAMYTLQPGDVIMTGTPHGVGPVVPGDTIRASVQGIGEAAVSVGAHYG
ncbi:fumarylacetoacetate hydrolase family protein [Aquabacterium sp. J223]|uniref:fumarylacetoacetate hydrolase family protein n=1 Tax=Aquabacterium sp. J223 TaxID=2898431 RepID=UPI0021AE05B5|nr:fumarylacetoacetate hydrolase family protein [Aquabacterium sp. J223]UUX95306.1 fumarylacetoacetate hydrolase family protein [Aquabacterium sp. J223]